MTRYPPLSSDLAAARREAADQAYAEDLHDTTVLLDRAVLADPGHAFADWPDDEREKALADALNNTWVEGISPDKWAALALATLVG